MSSPDYDAMRRDLAGKTVKELKQIAKDEGISLGYANYKAAIVSEIVGHRHWLDISGLESAGE